jgi:hypothetical protein
MHMDTSKVGPTTDNIGGWLWEHFPGCSNLGKMQNWLNYVMIGGIDVDSELRIILRCLQSRGSPPGEVPTWDAADSMPQTFQVGHW